MIAELDALHRAGGRQKTTNLRTTNLRSTKDDKMLLYEELARARMREAERDAAQRRQARQWSNARRWRRIAEWSARHAERAEAAWQHGAVPGDVR